MPNRFAQVMKFYFRSRLLWFLAPLLMGMLWALPRLAPTPGERDQATFWVVQFFCGYSGFLFLIYLKGVLRTSYAGLVPAYRLTHVLVALPTLVIGCILCSLFSLEFWGYTRSLGACLACGLLAFAVLAWFSYYANWVTLLSTLGLGLFLMSTEEALPLAPFGAPLINGEAPLQVALVFAAGILSLVALAYRIPRMSEESPEYHSFLFMNLAGLDRPGGLEVRRSLSERIFGLAAFEPGPAGTYLRSTTWARARLLRQSIKRMPSWFWGLGVCIIHLLCAFLLWVAQRVLQMGQIESLEVVAWILGMATFFSFMDATFQFVTRLPVLSGELLRPASRADYFKACGLALFSTSLEKWLSCLAGIAICALLWHPALLLEPRLWGGFVLGSSFVVFAFGLGAYSTGRLGVWGGIGASPVFFLWVVILTSRPNILIDFAATQLALALGLLLLGLWLCRAAYGVWCRAEIGAMGVAFTPRG